MEPANFFASSGLVIVAGKGGVGKTTVSAALAVAAARSGLRTLLVEVEGKSGIATMFGREPFSYEEVLLAEGHPDEGRAQVTGRFLTPDDALVDYLVDHGMKRLSKRLVSSGAIELVATAAPGIKDILVLGKVKQIERSGNVDHPDAPDLVVLDAPAAGHAITFLQSARGLVDAVRVGPINSQAKDVLSMLTDEARCQVVLVTLPEETPVNELVETAFNLEDRVGIKLGPVVVNGLYTEVPGLDADPEAAAAAVGTSLREGEAAALADAASFRLDRMALQREQVDRLGEELPLPQLRLPYLFDNDLGPAEIERLADALLDGVAALPDLTAATGEATP